MLSLRSLRVQKHSVAWRPTAGIMKPQQTSIARQRFNKHDCKVMITADSYPVPEGNKYRSLVLQVGGVLI
jgi:hypothetical protein